MPTDEGQNLALDAVDQSDDLDRYLGSDGLTADVLDRFHKQGNLVVVTIRSTAERPCSQSVS